MSKFPTTGTNLKRYRLEKALTLQNLADAVRIKNLQFFCNIENQRAGIPPRYVNILSKKLGVHKQVLIRWAVTDFEINYTEKVDQGLKRKK